MPDFDLDLNSFLECAAAYPENRVAIPVNYLENNAPDLLGDMQKNGLLLRDDKPNSIDYYGESCELHYLDNPDGTQTPFFFEEEGSFHTLKDDERRGWKITYSPLAEVLNTGLQCRGKVEEVITGFLWKIGIATQQSREVWLCRNTSTNTEVAERLKEIPGSALLFYFGMCGRNCELPEPYSFKFFNFIVERNGRMAFDGESVLMVLREHFATQSPGKSLKPAYGIQKNGRKAIENWLWSWLNARLMAAKIITGDDEEEDVCKEWAQFDVLSQKQVCDALKLDTKIYTRTKAAWEKDVAGYGQFFLVINSEFVQRRPQKNTNENTTAVQRLNDFYHAHQAVINELRRRHPVIV